MAWYTIYNFQVKAFNFILYEESRHSSLFQVLREREIERERETRRQKNKKATNRYAEHIQEDLSLHWYITFTGIFSFFIVKKK